MPPELVNSPRVWILEITLTAMDLFVSLFLIFVGRMTAAMRSATVGYVTVGFGVFLIYLSTGIWKTSKWKLVTRLALYVGTFCLVLTTLVFFIAIRHETMDRQTPLPAVSLLLLLIVVLSAIHLQRSLKEIDNG
jgi:hypothetical protein